MTYLVRCYAADGIAASCYVRADSERAATREALRSLNSTHPGRGWIAGPVLEQ